jgi:hypothetical protein
MDLYVITLAVGAVGMLAMAFGGASRGKAGSAGHAAHSGQAGHSGHAGHAGQGGRSLRAPSGRGGANVLLHLMSPRVLFSVCVGFGASGLIIRPRLGEGIILFGASLVLGVLFERALVTPIWNFAFRFASNPAVTLESAVMSDATAVTAFDANGCGLIAVEVDGRLVQLLGTLQDVDRELRSRVVAGSRLRIEAVDAERNRCTVSLR